MIEVEESIVALKNMGQSLEGDLHSLLAYYGENPDTPDAPKPEDFFGLILSFSSSLQVIISPISPIPLLNMSCRNVL